MTYNRAKTEESGESIVFPQEGAIITVFLGNNPLLKEVHLFHQHVWDESFSGCPNIEKIELSCDPENYTRILPQHKKNIFNSLEPLIIDESGVCVQYDVVLKADVKKLKGEVSLREGVKRLVPYVFKGCTKVTAFILPDSLMMIDKGAFQNCTQLQSIQLPSQIDWIDDDTFQGCKKLKYIKGTGIKSYGNLFGDTRKAEIIVPLIFPKVSISKTKDTVMRISLAMGYLLDSDEYPARLRKGYDQFIDEYRQIIIEKAKRFELDNVLSKLNTDIDCEKAKFEPLKVLSVAEAEELFDTSRKGTGLKIQYYKGNESIIDVPYTIGRTDVSLCYKNAFNKKAIVRCSDKLFKRLPIQICINDYIAYKEGTVPFSAEQSLAMDDWFKKDCLKAIQTVIESGNAEQLSLLFSAWENPLPSQLEQLPTLINSNAEINAVILSFIQKNRNI